MRRTHLNNPLHRIQKWSGEYYRPAVLHEVGTYLLVRHHTGDSMCDFLTSQAEFLEEYEAAADQQEQVQLDEAFTNARAAATEGHMHSPGPHPSDMPDTQDDIDMDEPHTQEAEKEEDEVFLRYMNDYRNGTIDIANIDPLVDEEDADDDEDVENDAPVIDFDPIRPYLPERQTSEQSATGDNPTAGGAQDAFMPRATRSPSDISVAPQSVPTYDSVRNAYVRIVHTNGIHNLAMVSCGCRGGLDLPKDLVACQLMPTSFSNVRTLFSTQVMDYFRLCNLELKASAYQFYMLLRRLTKPLAPAEVVNLYGEFRRTARFWRWLKKLKWAGFGHNGRHHGSVRPGELANFCPACPQPNVNLPDDWKADTDRSVHLNLKN